MWPFKKKEIEEVDYLGFITSFGVFTDEELRKKDGETRIKVVELQNGNISYYPQVFYYCSWDVKNCSWEDITHLRVIITLSDAQEAIDNYLGYRTKSTEYIKYP